LRARAEVEGKRPGHTGAAEIAASADSPDIEGAAAHYRVALAHAIELGMRPPAAHCTFGLAKLYRRARKPTQAHEHLVTAKAMYHEMDMRFWWEQADAQMRP
jgi:hypothetical protein